MNNIYL